MLMFVAGLEMNLSDLLRSSKVATLAGILGVLVPVVSGFLIGFTLSFDLNHAVFLGLTLGATSVSISAQTLMELKVLRSRVGTGLLGAAIFDDILVILLLSVFLAFSGGSGGYISVVWIFLRMIIFLGGSAVFGRWVLPQLVKHVNQLPISQGVLTLGLIVMFLYGLAAELIGSIAAITGAFLAGLLFARSPEKERLERGMGALAYSLFVPIYFVSIGLTVNLRQLDLQAIWLFLLIVLVAIIGKFLGAGWGARLAGFRWSEALQLGAGMISRGEVGLILATVGIRNGMMDSGLFSNIVGMVLITTLITPPLLRWLYRKAKPVSIEEQTA
jgi:Kef-type K+ transport system membrane component KefB